MANTIVQVRLDDTSFTPTPATSFSSLTASVLTADSATPTVFKNLAPNTNLTWNIASETVAGFEVSATLISVITQQTQNQLVTQQFNTNTSAAGLATIILIDPNPTIQYEVPSQNFVTIIYNQPIIIDVTTPLQGSGKVFVDYDTEFFYRDVSLFEYNPINTSNPLNHILYNRDTGSTITTGTQVALSAIRVGFNTNYSTALSTHSFIVSASKLDNEPFVRSLTAVFVQNPSVAPIGLNQSVQWRFESPIWAVRKNGTPYTTNTVAPLSDLNTIVFYVSAPIYNSRLQKYPLFSSSIKLSSPASTRVYAGFVLNNTSTPEWIYDGYPNIDLDILVNFETSKYSSFFYRLTSNSLYLAQITSKSETYTLNQDFSSSTYRGWYTLNNTPTQITGLVASRNFNRQVPAVSSVQVFLSANSSPESLTPWYTPHIFTKNLQARFVPYFLQADFIGFPDSYFNSSTTVKYLNATNYSESPGMFFYGEGHTGVIYLCASPQSNNVKYNWKIGPIANSYTVNPININTLQVVPNQAALSSKEIAITIPTASNSNFTIPLTLQLTDNNFTINDPIYYFDDIDGSTRPYPYCVATVDFNGNELTTTTTRFKQSIQVLPYSIPRYKFTPGLKPVEILPTDGSRKYYEASFRLLPGPEPCYDKYGLTWKWSTLENCKLTTTVKPSTWASTNSNTRFAKKWRFEGPLSATIFNVDPLSCTTGTISWTLSSSTGWPVIPLVTTLTKYPFNIRAEDFGRLRFTTSIYTPTDVTVRAEQTISCHITASNVPSNNQWIPKTSTVAALSTTTFLTTPELKFYIRNKYILTGSNIFLENQTTQQPVITSLSINFGNGTTQTYFDTDINSQYFSSSGYNTLGFKTITVTANTIYPQVPRVTSVIRNAFYVKDQYDEILPTEYQTDKEPLTLPWPEQPIIGSNDWVNDDNINSCFTKFYENLEYLKTRGQTYKTTYDEFYGYLAAPLASAENPAGCIAWTWEDLDPLNSILPETVTWKDVFYTGNTVTNGSQVACGTWVQHIRNLNTQLPTCYGLYELDWNWRALKEANSQTLITWKNSKCDQEYNKRWYYEPGSLTSFIICDEGEWNVNLPNLNRYYPTIANQYIQQRCVYSGIASRNNILYAVQKTQIKLLSSDYTATYFDTKFTSDKVREFSSLKNICLDSYNKIYVLDNIQAQITVFTYDPNATGDRWQTFTTWGGFGGRNSKTKFYQPNDLHIDHLDNVWVADTGNNCIKQYSNTGTWVQTITDSSLLSSAPLSIAVDSQKMVHVLTNTEIRVYTYEGEFSFAYSYTDYSSSTPRKINSSFNREIIYLVFDNEVKKFFRNGVFAGTIIHARENINNITSIYHDEYRNLLITTNDKILKYIDTMTIDRYVGILPTTYWPLSEMYIHQDEYVQNWVYTKSFQRLWDNIETFKNILAYSTTDPCKQYKPSKYAKGNMIVGQNEIVTSTVINRLLGYLWDNFYGIVEYFDPNCKT